MATINLGRVKPVFRGAYNASTSYVIDDIVTYQNETYIAITATTGNLPTVTSNWTKLAAKGTDGTDVSTTLTTQGDILYRDASGLARLGAGTSGQVLQTNGTGANPSWGTVSSEVVKLATGTFSTSASHLNLDNYFDDTTYNSYTVKFSTQNTNSSGNTIRFRWRSGGSELSAGAYYYTANIAYGNSSGNSNGTTRGWGHDHVAIGHFGNDNSERTIGEINLFSPTDSTGRPGGIYHSFAKDGSSQFATWKGGFMYNGAHTIDGFALYCPSGNFTDAGFWTLYGEKK